jgi:hypothetical protein
LSRIFIMVCFGCSSTCPQSLCSPVTAPIHTALFFRPPPFAQFDVRC